MVNMGEATENDRKKIVIRKDSKAFFHNNVDFAVVFGQFLNISRIVWIIL